MLRPTAPAPLRETGRGGSGLLAVLLGLGFALAVGARVAVGGSGPARSPAAGLVFAGLLVLMALAARTRVPISVSAATWGVAGAVLLSAPVALMRIGRPMHAAAGFASWAVVVAVVATAEELFLRGALYDAVRTAVDERAAIVAGAVGFAALHVPLYGWHVVPLDLIVGLVLGELRRASGTPAAPAVTHVGADLAAWFLR
ncbi:MAG: Type prenyl endopeptidase Rce1-like [Actinomycetota bacterium]|jgi:membrane protease YdiL (CAAX protease family)|nr:Type prenyl endopeptidase Rce1-like [Actinomycetota bacterium]